MDVAEETMGEAEKLDEEIAELKEEGQNYHTSPNPAASSPGGAQY